MMVDGVYTWFSPIEGSVAAKKMIEMNREFHLKRTEDVRKAKKFRVSVGGLTLEEGVDVKGEQYVDYVFGPADSKLLQVGKETAGKHRKGSQYTFTEKQWSLRAKATNQSLKENFQLFLLGFDVYNYTRAQLRSAVYEELNRKVGKITIDNIQFIDPHSLVSTCDSTHARP